MLSNKNSYNRIEQTFTCNDDIDLEISLDDNWKMGLTRSNSIGNGLYMRKNSDEQMVENNLSFNSLIKLEQDIITKENRHKSEVLDKFKTCSNGRPQIDHFSLSKQMSLINNRNDEITNDNYISNNVSHNYFGASPETQTTNRNENLINIQPSSSHTLPRSASISSKYSTNSTNNSINYIIFPNVSTNKLNNSNSQTNKKTNINSSMSLQFDHQRSTHSKHFNEPLHWPRYVTCDSNNRILISDGSNHCIKIFQLETGEFVQKFGSQGSSDGFFSHPRGIVTDPNDFILIADHDNDRVSLFHSTGEFIRQLILNISKPRGLAVSEGGLMVISNKQGLYLYKIFDQLP